MAEHNGPGRDTGGVVAIAASRSAPGAERPPRSAEVIIFPGVDLRAVAGALGAPRRTAGAGRLRKDDAR
jgi:hypothetical protein